MPEKIKTFLSSKYLDPIIKLLVQGTSPRDVSLAVSGAIVIGIFPVVGATTILCGLFAVRFKLNLPLVQLINYSLTPVQLFTIVPFMKMGEIFGVEKLRFTLSEIISMVGREPMHAITVLWNVTMQAIGAWMIAAPIIGYISYRIVLIITLRLRPVKETNE